VDSGRWDADENSSIRRTAEPLLVRREVRAARKGNDKGKVEGLVGYARRNFMVPVPRYAHLGGVQRASSDPMPEAERAQTARAPADHRRALEKDKERLLPLPAAPYEACDKRSTRVTSMALVRYRANDYSVPVEWGHREVLVKGSCMKW